MLQKLTVDILNLKSIENAVKTFKPKIILHCAGLSRPMDIHYKNIKKSININIPILSLTTKIPAPKIKLIYFKGISFIEAKEEIIKKQMLLNHLTIMAYQN